jgi:hypothetical protein
VSTDRAINYGKNEKHEIKSEKKYKNKKKKRKKKEKSESGCIGNDKHNISHTPQQKVQFDLPIAFCFFFFFFLIKMVN